MTEKTSPVNFRVERKGKRRTTYIIHVSRMKKFFEREETKHCNEKELVDDETETLNMKLSIKGEKERRCFSW